MKNFRKLVVVLAVAALVGFSGISAYAEQVGVVDIEKVLDGYSKAQDVSADLRVKEAELQKFLADADKQLKGTVSPVEKKNLQEKLSTEYNNKRQEYADSQAKQWKQVEENVFAAIDQIAKDQKMNLILYKASVLRGGADITNQIITILNKK